MRQPGSDTKVYVGSSSSMTYMASRVAIAKGQDVSACKRRKCLRRAPDDSMERFRLLAELFKEWVPRDLVGAIQMRREVSMLMVNAPRIYVGFLLGRERTWRQAILKVWGRMSPSTRLQIMGLDSHEQDLRATASQIMYTCFQTACQVWARHTEPAKWDDWKTHVDRGVVFHLSLTAWGLREGLLCKTTQAKSLGVQNQYGEWYGLASGVHTGQDHSHRMSRLHRVGRVLLETQAPSTKAQWLSTVEHVGARAQQMRIHATDYHFWSVFRTHLIVEMRHAGIDRLKLQQDWGQEEVAKAMVPDMSQWVPLWMKSAGNSLKTLLKQLQYTEPLEFLTCFACVLGDSAIDKHSTDELRSASHAITKERARVKAKSSGDFERYPAVIVQSAMSICRRHAPSG